MLHPNTIYTMIYMLSLTRYKRNQTWVERKGWRQELKQSVAQKDHIKTDVQTSTGKQINETFEFKLNVWNLK